MIAHRFSPRFQYPVPVEDVPRADRLRKIQCQGVKINGNKIGYNASDRPILFAVDFESEHAMGDSKTTYFESMAEVASFFLWQTGDPEFQVE